MKKKMVLSLFLMLLSVTLIATSTYAWFALNVSATLTGMEVSVKTPDDLTIAEIGPGTDMPSRGDYHNSMVMKSKIKTLKPASSTDGQHFFFVDPRFARVNGTYMTEREIDGEIVRTKFYPIEDLTDLEDFNTVYRTSGAIPYADYVFGLRAVNGTTRIKLVNLSKLSLTYEGTDGFSPSFRIAVFVQKVNKNGTAAEDTMDLLTILAPTGGEYASRQFDVLTDEMGTPVSGTDPMLYEYSIGDEKIYGNAEKAGNVTAWYASASGDALETEVKTVSSDGNAKTESKYLALSGEDLELDRVLNLGNKASLGIASPNDVTYFKVTVRLWLEGEDKKCTIADFAKLNGRWGLDLEITLDESPVDAVSEITSDTHYTGLLKGATSSTSITVDGFDYYLFIALNGSSSCNLYANRNVIDEDTLFYTFDETNHRMINVTYKTEVTDNANP